MKLPSSHTYRQKDKTASPKATPNIYRIRPRITQKKPKPLPKLAAAAKKRSGKNLSHLDCPQLSRGFLG